MRIAILINSLYIGGAERIAQFLGDMYTSDGDEVFYFLLHQVPGKKYSVAGKVVCLNATINDSKGALSVALDIIAVARKARKIKRRYKVDVCVSFMEDANMINVLSKGNERCILSVRTTLSARTDLNGLLYHPEWIRRVYSHADTIVAVSEETAKDLENHYFIKAKQLCVIPNPAIIRMGDKAADDRWIYGDKVFLSAGRMDPVKQQDRIIKVFSFLVTEDSEARLLFLGDGRLKRYLKAYARKLGIEDKVIFAGIHNCPGWYMQHARALIMTSKAEGFPNVMVEAMACGLPVISTDSPGGCGEILGQEKRSNELQYCRYGILTPYMSGKSEGIELTYEEKELKKAMNLVLDNDVYEKYKEASLERAQCYKEDRIKTMWDEVIR